MIPFLNSCIRKSSSQVFIDPSCNLLEVDEIVPKEVIEHYMKNMTEKEKKKYENLYFYRIQNKIRNLTPLTDEDFFQMNNFDKESIIILLKIANSSIIALIDYSKL